MSQKTKSGTRRELICQDCNKKFHAVIYPTGPARLYCDSCKYKRNYAAIRRWGKAHPEKLREYNYKWTKANHEKVREYRRKWTKANHEKVREYHYKWKKANPEKLHEYNKRAKARSEKAREQLRKYQKKKTKNQNG